MLNLNTISIEDFLAYAGAHPDRRFDFIDGELVDVSPKPLHGRLQAKLAMLIGNWLETSKVGYIHTEVLHVLNGEKFIPDISINRHIADDEAYFDQPPLLAIEIRSDTQSRAAQRRKAERYMAHGTPIVMVIMPGECIELFMNNSTENPHVYKTDMIITSIPELPELTIDVRALFATTR